MSEIVIRDLRPADVEEIARMAAAAWAPIHAYYRQVLGDELFAALHPAGAPEEKAAQVRDACQPGSGMQVLIAEDNGRIVGFVTFRADRASRVGEIGNNAVHPDCQGRGVAGRMYQEVFRRLKEMGIRFVKVKTGADPAHAPARRAYEKAGFTIQVPTVEYYRDLEVP